MILNFLLSTLIITRGECSEFLNKHIGVGIPDFKGNGVFFYYGTLLEVTDQYVKLKMDVGYKQINLDEIIEIKNARRLKK